MIESVKGKVDNGRNIKALLTLKTFVTTSQKMRGNILAVAKPQ